MSALPAKKESSINLVDYHKDLTINAPCYVANMPAEEYHAHPCSVSNSQLKLVARSPAHFKFPPDRAETRNKVLGSALHMAYLEPDLFYKTYTLLRNAKDRTASEYKEAKKAYGEELVLVSSEIERVEGIMNSLYKNPAIRKILELPGHNELSGFSTDPETGATCRHRFDKLTNCGIAVDLKTTVDARPDPFSRSILTYGYNIQNAFYEDQYNWITGDFLQDFVFIAIESESPYAAKLYRIDEDSLLIGREAYRKALDSYAYCLEMDEWPSYEDQEIEEIGIPSWAIKKHENELIESFRFTE